MGGHIRCLSSSIINTKYIFYLFLFILSLYLLLLYIFAFCMSFNYYSYCLIYLNYDLLHQCQGQSLMEFRLKRNGKDPFKDLVLPL